MSSKEAVSADTDFLHGRDVDPVIEHCPVANVQASARKGVEDDRYRVREEGHSLADVEVAAIADVHATLHANPGSKVVAAAQLPARIEEAKQPAHASPRLTQVIDGGPGQPEKRGQQAFAHLSKVRLRMSRINPTPSTRPITAATAMADEWWRPSRCRGLSASIRSGIRWPTRSTSPPPSIPGTGTTSGGSTSAGARTSWFSVLTAGSWASRSSRSAGTAG